MSTFTRDEMIAQLVAQNIPRHMAERAADLEIAQLGRFGQEIQPNGDRRPVLWTPERAVAHAVAELAPPTAIAWPVRLLLPWSVLVSDNKKFRARLITRRGKPEAIMIISSEYAAAKEKIAELAQRAVGDADPVGIPLRIRASVWVPDARPHDQSNFAKIAHDALEGVVYENDRWLYDVHWTRAGVDVDAPRAEITITPVPS